MFSRIVIATDSSELGTKAMDKGLQLAKDNGCAVVVVTASDPVSTGFGPGGFGYIGAEPIVARIDEMNTRQAQQILDNARSAAEAAGVDAEVRYVPHSRPSNAILETASASSADLIVMGSHGRTGVGRLLLGSQANEVLARAIIPVLIVK